MTVILLPFKGMKPDTAAATMLKKQWRKQQRLQKKSGGKASIQDFFFVVLLLVLPGLKKGQFVFRSLIKRLHSWELALKLSTGSLTSVSTAVNNNLKKQDKN